MKFGIFLAIAIAIAPSVAVAKDSRPEKVIYVDNDTAACAYGPIATLNRFRAKERVDVLRKQYKAQGYKVRVIELEPGIHQNYPWERTIVASHFC